jgi:hypothetical protein
VDSAVRFCHHGLARQFGVGADQRQLGLGAGLAHGLRHGVLEVRQRAKGPLARSAASAIQGECS